MLSLALWMSIVVAARSNAVVSDDAYIHSQTLIDVDHGRRLNLYCLGEGSPTVVFDAGLGDSTVTWGLIQSEIAVRTKTCSYDRAGLGFSDPAMRPGTSANSAEDLHRLLRAARIAPPYILVAHSLGGMNVRLYADRHLSEVAGMVLVDPSHEDMSRGSAITGPDARAKWDVSLVDRRACITTARTGFVPCTDTFKSCVPPDDAQLSPAINASLLQIRKLASFQQAVFWEMENVYDASADAVRTARRSYGDMPLIVLTRSTDPKGAHQTLEQHDAMTRLKEELHDQIASLSTRGVNRTVVDSGHYIQFNQPQVVTDAILEVLDSTRSQDAHIRK